VATEHALKTLPQYWDAVERGEKTFEVRRDDRGFQRGDILVLHRLPEEGTNYVRGQSVPKIRRTIGWILTGGQFGIEPGYVVLSLHQEAPHGRE
jgi:hypothetical protein